LLSVSDLLFDAYGKRLKLIEVVRHPVHLFNNVCSYIATFERAREFTLSFEFNGEKIPWFARSWAQEFANSSIVDRALLSIARMQQSMLSSIDQIGSAGRPFLVLSFENVVLKPVEGLQQLEEFLNRNRTRRTKRVFKQQGLPRKNISAGKATSAFSFNTDPSSTEAEVYNQVADEIFKSGTASAIAEFKLAIAEYNKRWPNPLADLEASWK